MRMPSGSAFAPFPLATMIGVTRARGLVLGGRATPRSSSSHAAHDAKAVPAKIRAQPHAPRGDALRHRVEVRPATHDATVGPGVRPLAHVADEVEHTIRGRAGRIRTDGRRPTEARFARVRPPRVLRVAPRPALSPPSARGLLPLTLARQAAEDRARGREPAAIDDGVRPRDPLRRLIPASL